MEETKRDGSGGRGGGVLFFDLKETTNTWLASRMNTPGMSRREKVINEGQATCKNNVQYTK